MRYTFRALSVLLLLSLLPSLAFAMSQGDEIKIGRQVLAELRPVGFTREAALTEVGNALKEHVERKDLPWQFWVLEDTEELNAFALPGGFAFISRRYYEMLTGDELAFVVAHEITHIDKRHHERKLKKAKQAQLYEILAGIIIHSTKASRGWQTVADAGTAALYTKYSREMEREADFGGYTLARKAGFDAEAAVTALSKLGEDKKDPIFGTIFSTHPLLSSREDRLEALESDKTPARNTPRRTVDKAADLDWQPPHLSRDELKTRPGIAVRVVDEEGILWDNKWREDFRSMLSHEIEVAGKYDVRGEGRAGDKRDPKLSDLKRRDRADKLLVITVHQIDAEVKETLGDYGADALATVSLSAAMTDTSTAAETSLSDTEQVLADRIFLPIDDSKLYLDMPVTQALLKASRQLAARISPSSEKAVALHE
ncbi:MAG: M48 family metalloprotease [Armatimonadetes bacterium]|nr:M48 family metalloprotease [Armatimonadota bacterium]NIO74847.1 M48 family metalloprotease [Armatimonadota bacterium]NIO95609.1 M48 family metalloprotease [Armatimonadota bacterium]